MGGEEKERVGYVHTNREVDGLKKEPTRAVVQRRFSGRHTSTMYACTVHMAET